MPKAPSERFVAMLGMTRIVELLNSDHDYGGEFSLEARQRLQRTVRAWFESGPNLDTMHNYQHRGDPTFRQMKDSWEGLIVGHQNGRAQMVPIPTVESDAASRTFVELTLNPECARLALPCENEKCRRWYLKTRLGKSRFCTRRCLDTWKLTSKRRIAAADKLKRVEAALKNWASRPARHANAGWKEWLRDAEPNITQNFVTRAITDGKLTLSTKP